MKRRAAVGAGAAAVVLAASAYASAALGSEPQAPSTAGCTDAVCVRSCETSACVPSGTDVTGYVSTAPTGSAPTLEPGENADLATILAFLLVFLATILGVRETIRTHRKIRRATATRLRNRRAKGVEPGPPPL